MKRLAPAALLLLAAAAPAQAATRVTAAAPEKRVCHARVAEGERGVDVLSRSVARSGIVSARLAGPAGSDWDLALFDADSGRRLAGSASFGPRELASARVARGQRLLLQACRLRGGGPASVSLSYAPAPAAPSEPSSLVRIGVSGRGDLERLARLGIDLTEHVGQGTADAVLHSSAERSLLRAAGYEWQTLVPDLAAQDRADRAADRSNTRRLAGRGSALPSGRTEYRSYPDYQADLKQLVDNFPGLVRPVTLPLPSIEGRPIEGVEIAGNVNRTDDGRPVYVNMGLHHAREWPAGEMTMEFGITLANGYGSDPRITSLLDGVRVFVIPVVNPDGYVVSHDLSDPDEDTETDPSPPVDAITGTGAYRRKNCRAASPAEELLACESRSGVDLNRNYGAYWGGAGAGTSPTDQNFRGSAPFSEPESEAVHRFSSGLQIVTLITNHTFTDEGYFLRQPGFQQIEDEEGEMPDEARMKALGDAMADATGYLSDKGYVIGDITGATEDWNYFAQGTFGYTPEMRAPNFHSVYADAVIGEYDGEGAEAGLGMREAFLRAGEQAADTQDHSVIAGSAPAGATLRLRKTFSTPTSTGLQLPDTLETTLTAPADGTYEWHVNPSTRPLSAPGSEAWTLTCERSGAVRETQSIVVGRGQAVTANLACPLSSTAAAPPPGAAPPPPPAAPRLARLLTRSFRLSARRANARRRFRVPVEVRDGRARTLRARLTRGGRTVASGARARLSGRGTITLRVKRRVRMRAGRHRLLVTAIASDGRRLRATRTVRVRR